MAGSDGPEILYWTAPMGMDLVPVFAGQAPSGDPAEVTLSAAEITAIGVRRAIARSNLTSLPKDQRAAARACGPLGS
ncbi:hypothetical protein [Yoonia algicola]|uniref:Uncharacterized protein n=1 Tax=Yoonia algicola TaxID=3137368 RepID=A0AAN0MGG7_9RHOB